MRCKGLEEFAHEFAIKSTNFLRRQLYIPHQERARREVQSAAHLRVIHRQVARAIAHNSTFIAKCLCEGLTERDACVLHRVVIINVQITLGTDGHVNERVARQLIQHMIEETNAGLIVIDTCAVEIDLNGNVRLGSCACYFSRPHWGAP